MRQPSHRLTDWVAFFELEPFGPIRTNMHLAELTAITFNTNVTKRQHMKPASEFMWKDPHQRTLDLHAKAERFIDAL